MKEQFLKTSLFAKEYCGNLLNSMIRLWMDHNVSHVCTSTVSMVSFLLPIQGLKNYQYRSFHIQSSISQYHSLPAAECKKQAGDGVVSFTGVLNQVLLNLLPIHHFFYLFLFMRLNVTEMTCHNDSTNRYICQCVQTINITKYHKDIQKES